MMQVSWCVVIFVFLGNVSLNNGRISNKRQCGDPTCSHPVSLAKTLIRYISDDDHVLSFSKNIDVTIYSKSAGSNPSLWGAEIKGKRGYVPKAFVREYKIFKDTLPYMVDTDEAGNDIEIDIVNVTDTASTISSSIESNRAAVTNEEAELNADDPLLKLNGISGGDNTRSKTPSLSKTSVFTDFSFPSFPGSGVYAETIESETEANPQGIAQPYDVIDGTTLYLDTDGTETKDDAIHPTVTAPSQPTVLHKHGTMDDSISPSSQEISNTDDGSEEKNNGEDVEESSGDIYQYITSWISEDKNEPEEVKANEESNEKDSLKASGTDVKASEINDSNLGEERKEDTDLRRSKRDIGIHRSEEALTNLDTSKEAGSVADRNVQITNAEGEETTDDRKEEKVSSKGDELTDQEEQEEEVEDYEDNEEDSEEGDEDDDIDEELEVSAGEEKKESTEIDMTTKIGSDLSYTEDKKEDSKILIDKDLEKVDLLKEPSISISSEHQNLVLDGKNVKESEILLGNQHVTPLPEASDAVFSAEKTATHHDVEDIKNVIEAEGRKPDETNPEGQMLYPDSSLNQNEQNMEKGPPENNNNNDNNNNNKSELLQSEIYEHLRDSLTTGGNELMKDTSFDKSQTDIQIDPSTDRITTFPPKEITESSVAEDVKTEIPSYDLHTEPTPVSPELSMELTSIASQEESPQVTIATSSESLTETPFVASTDEPYIEKEEKGTSAEVLTDSEQEVYLESNEEMVKQSDGYISDLFVGLFSGFSSVQNAPEDSEGEMKVLSEDILKVEDVEERLNEKGSAAWTSFWGGGNRDDAAAAEERKSFCTEDDLSSGIGSECSEVVGQRPTFPPIMEGVPNQIADDDKVPEDDVFEMDPYRSSYDVFVCLIITGATVLMFSLGYFYLEKKRRDGSLVAKINKLEKALLVSSKECLILKDDLDATKQKLLSIENSSVDSSETVTSLNVELEEYKVAKTELEEQVSSLEKELEAATEAGLELNRMLSDFLSTQNSSDTVMKSVEHLQKQLDSQQATITSLTESLNVKTTENENLQTELNAALEKINALEEDVHKVNENLTDVLSEKLRMEEELLEKNKTLFMEIEEVKNTRNSEISDLQKEISTLQETITEMKDILVTRESEVTVLQDCLKQLKCVDDGEGDDKLQALLDVGQTKAELKIMQIARDNLAERLQGEEDARKLLEDHLKAINDEIKRLRDSYEESEKEKVEAQTRLEVLSDYFKEKETQLQKELGLQEAMYLQKEGDATTTYERIKSLQEEIENYKSQNEMLKKEILDQERGLKCQIASLEKKAHENWVAARQAERKLEENKQEASQLRNRLTIVEKNATNASKNSETPKIDRLPGDSNGELPTSPIHMGISLEDSPSSPQLFQHHDGLTASPPLPPMPPTPFMGLPPHGVFMPPPPPPPGAPYMPPPPLFPDRRPPPLGRMSSPPPRGSFSPYDDHSPPPSPPPGRYRSPPPHLDESSDRFRTHRSSPTMPNFNPYPTPTSRLPPHWDDPHGTSRSGFRPLPPTHRDSPREPKDESYHQPH